MDPEPNPCPEYLILATGFIPKRLGKCGPLASKAPVPPLLSSSFYLFFLAAYANAGPPFWKSCLPIIRWMAPFSEPSAHSERHRTLLEIQGHMLSLINTPLTARCHCAGGFMESTPRLKLRSLHRKLKTSRSSPAAMQRGKHGYIWIFVWCASAGFFYLCPLQMPKRKSRQGYRDNNGVLLSFPSTRSPNDPFSFLLSLPPHPYAHLCFLCPFCNTHFI